MAADAAISDDTLQQTLLLAQKFVDQTKRESEAEAAELVAQAEEQARTDPGPGRGARPGQLATDADRRLREEVTRLEAMRGQLASDVENMARHLESRADAAADSALAEVLKWVEENIQPANSLMALRSHDEEKAADVGEPPARPEAERTGPGPAQGQLAVKESGPAEGRPEGPGPEVRTAGSPAGDRA